MKAELDTLRREVRNAHQQRVESADEVGSHRSQLEQLRELAKQKWSKLTDHKFDMIAGKRDELLDWLQTQYGISKAEAELEVQEWEEVIRDRERHPRS